MVSSTKHRLSQRCCKSLPVEPRTSMWTVYNSIYAYILDRLQFWLRSVWEHVRPDAGFRYRSCIHGWGWTPIPPAVRDQFILIWLISDLTNVLIISGHTFSVIQSASGGQANFVNPPRRDVVASGTSPDNGQPTRIRFQTDNPGAYYLEAISPHTDWPSRPLVPPLSYWLALGYVLCPTVEIGATVDAWFISCLTTPSMQMPALMSYSQRIQPVSRIYYYRPNHHSWLSRYSIWAPIRESKRRMGTTLRHLQCAAGRCQVLRIVMSFARYSDR